MRVLTLEHWSSFQEIRNDSKKYFNGVKFESLIKDILFEYFPGIWNPTSVTWDGGRDFIDISLEGAEAWVECKMYAKSLSISRISNSLVMAINRKNVNQLIFFSYSRLNENAIMHLADFSASTDIVVQIFDDEKLEELILRKALIITKHFPSATDLKMPSFESILNIQAFFTKNIQTEYSQIKHIIGSSKKSVIRIPVNTPCLYEIFIQNNELLKKNELTVDLSSLNTKQAIRFLNCSKLDLNEFSVLKKMLNPAQVFSLKLYLSPAAIGKITIPPVITLLGKHRREIPSLDMEVSVLNRAPLVGSFVHQTLKDFEINISGSSQIAMIVVVGKTGVGKSRLLEEMKIKLLTQNYIIMSLNGYDDTCKTFSSFSCNLLSQVWRLPNTSILKKLSTEEYPVQGKGHSSFDKVCSLLLGSIHNDNTINFSIDDIYELFAEGFLHQKIALLIDNVQALDAESIQLLMRIKSNIPGCVGMNTLIFSFNIDELIYSQASTLFFQEIKQDATLQDNDPIRLVELPEFSRSTVEIFLNTICGFMDNGQSFADHYPLLFQLIYENVLPRPLDLYQLFLAAQDSDDPIAILKNGFFHIRKIDAFHGLVRSVTGKTEKIYELRLSYLKDNPSSLKVISAVALLDVISLNSVLNITGANESDVEYLVNAGWIKYNDQNEVTCFHPSISRFIIEVLQGKKYTGLANLFSFEIKKHLFDLLQEYTGAYGKMARFFLAQEKTKFAFSKALDEIACFLSSSPNERLQLFAFTIFNFAIDNDSLLIKHIGVVEGLCRLLACGNIEVFVNAMKRARRQLRSFIPETDYEAMELCKITRQLAGYASHIGRALEADALLVEEINLTRKLPSSVSASTKLEIEINLLNRRCVCLKDIGNKEDALVNGLLAFNLAEQYHFNFFTCLSLLDIATIYKDEISEKESFKQYIYKALKVFNETRIVEDKLGLKLACLENKARIASIDRQYEAAIELTDKYLQMSRPYFDPAYRLRGLSMKAVFIIQACLVNHPMKELLFKSVKNILNEIEDLSILARLSKFYTKALHLQAVYANIQNDLGRTEEFYSAALESIVLAKNKTAQYCYFSPSDQALIMDAANFWITYTIQTPFPVSDRILHDSMLSDITSHLSGKENIEISKLFGVASYNLPMP